MWKSGWSGVGGRPWREAVECFVGEKGRVGRRMRKRRRERQESNRVKQEVNEENSQAANRLLWSVVTNTGCYEVL